MSSDYEKMLEKAREKIPNTVTKKERFEIPKLFSFVEGNRTIIRNFSEAAKTVRREQPHLLKYLVKDMATQGFVQGERAIITGKFSGHSINERFGKYVNEYVLCSECSKPDTKLLKQERITFLKCEACGARKTVKKI